MRKITTMLISGVAGLLASCSSEKGDADAVPMPKEIIDLGALVTEDLPERVWGKALMTQFGFDESNRFDVRHWDYAEGAVSGSNAYYSLFNHGGPHVDAPSHVGVGKGLDSYAVQSFVGPLKVVDASGFPTGRTITSDVFKAAGVGAGDIVLVYTAYLPPQTDDEIPSTITLTREAAEYLATLPVRAFGTDAFSVASLSDQSPVEATSAVARAVPIHHSFLSRGIPVYEQLFNVEKLLGEKNMLFVGAPLNIKDGDGMMVRPLVFVF